MLSVVFTLYFGNIVSGTYQYDVTISTVGESSTLLSRQHYLSDNDAFPTHDKFIRFRVKGKAARFYLESAEKTVQDRKIFYSIFIGNWGNTKSAILLINQTYSEDNDYARHKMTEFHGSILSEAEFREFWMSWCGETIKVGHGPNYNTDLIMSWRNPSQFRILDVAISSGYSCDWEFQSNDVIGNSIECPSNDFCNSYSKVTECLKFNIVQTISASRPDCAWACSDDKTCWAWKQDSGSGTCDLLSGNVEQTNERMTCFFKRQE